MIIPADKLIVFLFFVKNLIIELLHFRDIIENNKRGVPIPIPKNKKLNIFVKKFVTKRDLAKRAAIKAGLQGTTIAPKKNPNINALSKGFFKIGA